MSVTSDEVLRIARLAQLDLDPETAPRLVDQLRAILDYVAALNELALGATDPAAGAGRGRQPLRADEPLPSLPRERALANAPDAAGGCFRVPRMIEE